MIGGCELDTYLLEVVVREMVKCEREIDDFMQSIDEMGMYFGDQFLDGVSYLPILAQLTNGAEFNYDVEETLFFIKEHSPLLTDSELVFLLKKKKSDYQDLYERISSMGVKLDVIWNFSPDKILEKMQKAPLI